MIITDVHMHTNNSGDSQALMKDMIQSSIDKGLEHICFTDHHDMDFPYIEGQDKLFELDYERYRKDYLNNLQVYGNKIDMSFGIELGIMPSTREKLKEYMKDNIFDFTILSSHTCTERDVYYPDYYDGRTDAEAFNIYFKEIYDNVTLFDDFDIYGHIDYVVRYCPRGSVNYHFEDHYDVLEALLKVIIEKGKGIELNTGGLRSPLGEYNPSKEILKLYHSLGGEIITVGADAHSPQVVADRFDLAEEVLKEVGFKYVAYFKKHKPEFIKL